ncbi:MAG: hypothetical protein JXB48_11080 [Candidatus Latescibacteria bacterium]|nr:hypothetical protein [Candidatus Latescibacterota bacterium]
MRYILLVIVSFSFMIQAADGPTDKVSPQDYADPKLKKFDKRIWQNLLKYYVHARQIARSTLDELESVKDFCWSSYRYLYAIERAANRAQLVWDNVRNFKAENPVDAIIYLEEDVFQKSDLLFKNDIPAFKERREELAESRDVIRNRAAGHLLALNNILPDGLKFQKKFLRLLEINSPDASMMNDTTDKDVNFHAAALSQSARQIASTDASDEFSDNQSAILESTIKNAANNGTSDPLHQSEMTKISERNALILSLQENTYLTDGVKIGSYFLLEKIKRHSDELAQKQALFFVLEDFSDKLNAQDKN